MSSEPDVTAADGEFAVILERASAKPDAEMGRLLAYHFELHPTDAIARVRYGGGLVVENVTESRADDLVERLRGIGVQARKISNSLYGLVPRGVRAFGLEMLDEAVIIRLIGGRRIEVPRQNVFALQVHGLRPEAARPPTKAEQKQTRGTQDMARGSEAGNLGPRGQKLHDGLVQAGLERLELHLALYAEAPGPIRVQKDGFDFTCLGPDRAEHSLDNFILLLERVLEYLPRVWNREPAAKFLETLDPRPLVLFKREEAENIERWLYEHFRLEALAQAEASAAAGRKEDPT